LAASVPLSAIVPFADAFPVGIPLPVRPSVWHRPPGTAILADGCQLLSVACAGSAGNFRATTQTRSRHSAAAPRRCSSGLRQPEPSP